MKRGRGRTKNYRGICLLLMVSRLTGKVLQKRLGGIAERHIRDATLKFPRRRRAGDAVLIARRFSEDEIRYATNAGRVMDRGESPGHTRAPREQVSSLEMERARPGVITSHLFGDLMELGCGAASTGALNKRQGECEYAVRWKSEQSDGCAQEKGPKEGRPTCFHFFLHNHMSASDEWREVGQSKTAEDGRGSRIVGWVSEGDDCFFQADVMEKHEKGRTADYGLAELTSAGDETMI